MLELYGKYFKVVIIEILKQEIPNPCETNEKIEKNTDKKEMKGRNTDKKEEIQIKRKIKGK